MINSFKSYLVEEEKTVYFTFGRMNPPTIGHEKLLNKLASSSRQNPYRVYLSQSTDKKKNPLNFASKVKHARKMFPKHARQIMADKKVKTVFDALVKLYKEGFKNVAMVVGSDRVNEFEVLLNKYNGEKARHGLYNFSKITIISAGERDPDADGAEGMSASKMRAAASKNDFTSFSQGLPKTLSNADAKKLYNEVRKSMGLKEQKEFKNHVQLESVSEVRENYIKGNLYAVGDKVVIKENNEVVTVTQLGSNYVIVENKNGTYRKWLDAIEILEKKKERVKMSKQDSDIGGRPGTQPKVYHQGLSKKQKIARDRQFKRQAKMDDDNPAAYKKAPGDATAKTKPSRHTKRFKQMFGDD